MTTINLEKESNNHNFYEKKRLFLYFPSYLLYKINLKVPAGLLVLQKTQLTTSSINLKQKILERSTDLCEISFYCFVNKEWPANKKKLILKIRREVWSRLYSILCGKAYTKMYYMKLGLATCVESFQKHCFLILKNNENICRLCQKKIGSIFLPFNNTKQLQKFLDKNTPDVYRVYFKQNVTEFLKWFLEVVKQ